MSRQPSKFDQMCKAFELRLERAKAGKVTVKNPINETVSIDDDVMLVEISNPVKSKPKEVTKREVQLFGNVTGKLQNIPQKNEICVLDENCLKVNAKITNVDLNVQPPKPTSDAHDEKLKKSCLALKPENYRIQQVIKEQDLVFFDLETGGMGYKEDILQIGALNYEGKLDRRSL